jgi:serine/threonine-protein kinase
MEVVIKHLREPVPSAHQLRNDLSQYPDIDAFIQKGMAKAPAERYQTPREFLLALERIQQQISTRPLPRQAYLVLLPDERPIPLVDETITVGRPAPNRPKPDICLTDERVSRSHARLYKRQGTYAIEALSSKNRTCLNEQILPLGEEHILKHNDRLQFGPVEGRFELR